MSSNLIASIQKFQIDPYNPPHDFDMQIIFSDENGNYDCSYLFFRRNFNDPSNFIDDVTRGRESRFSVIHKNILYIFKHNNGLFTIDMTFMEREIGHDSIIHRKVMKMNDSILNVLRLTQPVTSKNLSFYLGKN